MKDRSYCCIITWCSLYFMLISVEVNMAAYSDDRYAFTLSKVVLEGDLGEMFLGAVYTKTIASDHLNSNEPCFVGCDHEKRGPKTKKKQTCSGPRDVHGLGVIPNETISRRQGVFIIFTPDDGSHALLNKLNL